MAIGLEHRLQKTFVDATRLNWSVGSIRAPSSPCDDILFVRPTIRFRLQSCVIVAK
jgi:hypothetical protein